MIIHLHHRYQYLGTHIEYEDSLAGIMISAIDNGLYAFSFSLGNSRNYTRKKVDSDDLLTTMGLISRFPVVAFSFIPSMYNLCGHRNFLAWNGNVNQDKKTTHIIDELVYEMGILAKLGGSVIMEPGAHRNKIAGLKTVIKSLDRTDFKQGHKLVLMNSLDSHSNVCISLKDLSQIYQGVDITYVKSHIYIGIHLAYLFTNGLYDFRHFSEIKRLFSELDNLFPKEIVSVIYLTDTFSLFGSKQHDYAPIGFGNIWNDRMILNELLMECEQREITVLTQEIQDLNVIREISNDLFSE